jgi:hypothetical protein
MGNEKKSKKAVDFALQCTGYGCEEDRWHEVE